MKYRANDSQNFTSNGDNRQSQKPEEKIEENRNEQQTSPTSKNDKPIAIFIYRVIRY